ncbi:hypothetical protein GAYE_SCF43G5622 [Galdieria yellowstonensis]|uniref:60S acidic ribosomal protein P1 n=1 Tax=Galdieria yellowstonensis TaxID=3028027 RepID=A0AAV9IK23_9RHOD|nr:hypothetical protein GAYE_SCF43G5622 [Galdieria yellowstonensis]
MADTHTAEMACVYAGLILHDEGLPITDENIKTLLNAAQVHVEPFWPGLFARMIQKVDVDGLITNIGSAPSPATIAAVAASGAAAGGAAAPAKEEAKEEAKKEEEEEDEDLGLGLFD